MRKQAFVLAVLLVSLGVAVNLRGTARSTVHTKAWLAEHTPTSVGEYHTKPGPDGSNETYQMDIPNLKAAGIVCRTMTSGTHEIDTVVLNSDRGESFHDPIGCFKAQEWEIVSQKITMVETKTLGQIPVNNLVIKHAGSSAGLPAVYCFRRNRSIYADQSDFMRVLFMGELMSAQSQQGTLYRFIALDGQTTEKELLEFAGQFMDRAMQLNPGG